MTKEQFIAWLQKRFDMNPGNEQQDDVWREIEDQGLLAEVGVTCAWDWVEQTMYFRLADGLLASNFEIGIEQETVWFFAEGQVESNMRESCERALGRAIGRSRDALDALEALYELR